ncbi:hypothetical protein A3K63_02215 [Candidatus Micrarchaeota archaeon RBG_16_49_10]|nr:MAG: hypothetical protein A3K63_02215 [Candidatus Micrarchaeota archaeon RBG_16_49_10]
MRGKTPKAVLLEKGLFEQAMDGILGNVNSSYTQFHSSLEFNKAGDLDAGDSEGQLKGIEGKAFSALKKDKFLDESLF